MENKNSLLSAYCVKYGESTLSRSMVFLGEEKEKTIPISFCIYLIRSKGRNILIDAGCDTMPGFVMKNFYSPTHILEEIGIFAEDITDVIITHAHHDHIEALKHFVNATVHITKEQYNRGKIYIPANFPVNIINDTYTVTEHIKIIKWGGHDFGSAIAQVKTDNVIHIFAGDECYTNANIENKICSGCVVNKDKGTEFVNKFSDKRYRVHTCHDDSLKTERII